MKKLGIFLQNSTKIQYKVQIHSLTLGSNFEDNIKSQGFSLLQRLSGMKMNKLRAKLEG